MVTNLPSGYRTGGHLRWTLYPNPQTKLGFVVDKDQVNKITSAAFCSLRLIKKIEKCLPLELLKTVTMALILRRIDYCNSLYLTLAIGLVKRLQILQNTAARFLFKIPKYEATRGAIRKLHWLPVK